MKNTIINRKVIQKVANALGDLNNQVIYVGGATVSLYCNDPAADDVRPTKDIDISIKVASLAHLEEIREELVKRGFKQTADLDVICRFKLDDILVDVMATKPVGWAPGNPWFEEGFNNLQKIDIDGTIIQIMPLTYFLASKFTAHLDRGGTDPRFSHDFEDITYILDNRIDWHKIIKEETGNVKTFLLQQLQEIKENHKLQEAILANLYYETQEDRFQKIMDKIDFCLEGNK
jgi:predicted nucleotidyltransferase